MAAVLACAYFLEMLVVTKDMQEFFLDCGLDLKEFPDLEDDLSLISDIVDDFNKRQEELTEVAVGLSRLVQKIPGVHSVRWRIKDYRHLVRKIIRKKSKNIDKYKNINQGNYREIVTDLIGIRALHLFKEEFSSIHRRITDTWDLEEQSVAYVRAGDSDLIKDQYRATGLDVEEHNDGYRSVHYIIKTQMTKKIVRCELQVRTIFEEGWSEIDHKVRYPDYNDDPLIRSFLHVFNRISGAADEMGTFVHQLAKNVADMKAEFKQREGEAGDALRNLSDHIEKMEKISVRNQQMQDEIKELRALYDKEVQQRKALEQKYMVRYSALGSLSLPALNSIAMTSERDDIFGFQAFRLGDQKAE